MYTAVQNYQNDEKKTCDFFCLAYVNQVSFKGNIIYLRYLWVYQICLSLFFIYHCICQSQPAVILDSSANWRKYLQLHVYIHSMKHVLNCKCNNDGYNIYCRLRIYFFLLRHPLKGTCVFFATLKITKGIKGREPTPNSSSFFLQNTKTRILKWHLFLWKSRN